MEWGTGSARVEATSYMSVRKNQALRGQIEYTYYVLWTYISVHEKLGADWRRLSVVWVARRPEYRGLSGVARDRPESP